MNFLRVLWAKWQTSRMFCRYCREVPVSESGAVCSDECAQWAKLEDSAW